MPYIIILKVRKFHQSTRIRFGTAGKKLAGGCTMCPPSLNRVKAFWSLQAYNQTISAFISSVLGHKINNKYVVLAKVRHSQKMNDPFVQIWTITNIDRTILSAICAGCMAGLGKCCSHIASVLFYIEYRTCVNGKLSCTQVKCTWLLPTYVKQVDYARVRDIDSTSAKKLKANLDKSIENLDTKDPRSLLVPMMCVLLFLDMIRSELQYQKQRSSNNFMILCLNARTSPFV